MRGPCSERLSLQLMTCRAHDSFKLKHNGAGVCRRCVAFVVSLTVYFSPGFGLAGFCAGAGPQPLPVVGAPGLGGIAGFFGDCCFLICSAICILLILLMLFMWVASIARSVLGHQHNGAKCDL
jgi:hypothetical protein